MNWIKKGLIFKAEDIRSNFIKSHVQIPTVLVLKDRLRVYFATRPNPPVSVTTYMDLDLRDPKKILYIHQKPILELGADGMFDEHGIMPNFVYRDKDKYYLHYVGWSRRDSIPYSNWIGIAQSKDEGKTFSKMFDGPFLDRTKDELYSLTGTWMIKKKNIYYLFYAKGTDWVKINGNYENQYNIVLATSEDGFRWSRKNEEIFLRKDKFEASTRPTVIYKDCTYHMWFCYRNLVDFRDGDGAYRIGYAWSNDLENWNRQDEKCGINLSEDGWDNKMIAYPYIVETLYGTYLFYNGNGFGQSGFGYALLNEHSIDG